MALFTGLAVAGFLAVEASFFTTAVAFGLNAIVGIAASIGISYAAKALGIGKPEAAQADGFSAQGKLQAAGDVPRSFQLGYSVTAGSLVYANEWGHNGETPNASHTQVIALQDVPGGSLVEVWVNGELCTLGPVVDSNLGAPVDQYKKDGKDHLWIKYYDGTQTEADPLCVNYVASADRPYEATRIGTGVAYAVCTSFVEDTLFTGLPTYKFALSGIPLYDISKDSTAGGSGSHRWSDPTTWGGDGDNLPAVQIYNILRGIYFDGQWLYGLQAMSAARLPADNWIAQINKCRAEIMGEGGLEPTYRSGLQVTVNSQIANAVEALLTACQGRLSEIGGFYKIHLGAPDSPTFSFTDADTLSSEEQIYKPFFALSDSINGIAAKYPLPAEGWNTKVAPPIYRSDLEALDGGRRLLANPSFDAVPYSAQVQRLMSSALEEAQRARTHVLSLSPSAWILEPGDIVAWSSVRNGYEDKLFRVDGVVDRANLDVGLSITEVDPSDYDWDHETDFEPIVIAPTVFVRPAPQGILDWFAEGVSIDDPDGVARRPAIRLEWDGSLPGVEAIEYQVRLASNSSPVTEGASPPGTFQVGAIVVQAVLPNVAYQARGRYVPTAPRDMLWSSWLNVTTPDIRLSEDDFDPRVAYKFDRLVKVVNDQVQPTLDLFRAVEAELDAQTFMDKYDVRTQVDAIRLTGDIKREEVRTELQLGLGDAVSSIEEVRAVNVSNSGALTTLSTSVNARFQDVTASVTSVQSALATNVGAVASLTTSVDARFEYANSSFSQTATTIANLNGAFSTYQTTVSSQFASVISSVTTNATAISTLDSSFANYQVSVSSQFASANSNITSNATAISNTYASLASLNTTVTAVYGELSGSINTNATAISNANATIASLTSTVTANYGGLSASVSTNATAIATTYGQLAAKYTLSIDVNGYIVGSESINTGGFGVFRLKYDAVQIAAPGLPNQYVWQISTVNGFTAMTIRGDIIADGSIFARSMTAGSITAENGAIANLSVQSLKIGDNAVSVTSASFRNDGIGGNNGYQVVSEIYIGIDTTGLSGKKISLLVNSVAKVTYPGSTPTTVNLILKAQGTDLMSASQTQQQPSIALAGIYDFTANGGYMVMQAQLLYYGELSGLGAPVSYIYDRTLTILAVKR